MTQNVLFWIVLAYISTQNHLKPHFVWIHFSSNCAHPKALWGGGGGQAGGQGRVKVGNED